MGSTIPTAQRWIGGTFADPFSGSRTSAPVRGVSCTADEPSLELRCARIDLNVGTCRADQSNACNTREFQSSGLVSGARNSANAALMCRLPLNGSAKVPPIQR